MAKKINKTEIAQEQVTAKVPTTKKSKVEKAEAEVKPIEKKNKNVAKVSEVAPEPKKQTAKEKEKELKKEANLIKKAIMKSPAPKAKENLEFSILPKEEPKKKTKGKKAEPAPVVEVKPEPKKSAKAKKAEPAPVVEATPEPKKSAKTKKTEATPVVEATPEPKKSAKAKKAEPTPVVEATPEPKKETPQSPKVEEKQETTTKPSVRYSDEELEMFKNVILEAKREAADELRMLKERLDDLNSYDLAEESMIYSMHMGEQGSEPMEKEKTYAQIQRINEYIKKLDDALERIKDKTYGICRVCGILIAKERLLAVPITTLSASWKIHNRCPEDGLDRIIAVKQ